MAPCSMRPRPLHATSVDSKESRAASAADAVARVVSETDTAFVAAAATTAVAAAAVDAATNDATARRALVRARPWALRPGSPREGIVGGGTHVAGSSGHCAVGRDVLLLRHRLL